MAVTVTPTRVRPGDEVLITVDVSGEIGTKYDRFEFGLLGGGTWMATANLPGNNIHTPSPAIPMEVQGKGVFEELVEQTKADLPDAVGVAVAPGAEVRFPIAVALPNATFTTIATKRVRSHVRIAARVELDGGDEPWVRVELNVPTAPA